MCEYASLIVLEKSMSDFASVIATTDAESKEQESRQTRQERQGQVAMPNMEYEIKNEDIGKPGDPLRFAIEELTPITYPVLGFHVGDKVWLPVEQRLVERSPLFLWALGEHI